MTTTRSIATLAIVVALAAGCSKPEEPYTGPTPRELLVELSDVYSSAQLMLQHPPAKLADLAAGKRAGAGRAIPAAERGDLVVDWGKPFRSPADKNPRPPGILAYDKNAPKHGGWVLLQDGTVTEMSPSAFAAAPKAAP